jgi:hypothetical protein
LEFFFKDILFFLSSLLHILCPDLHLDNFAFLNNFDFQFVQVFYSIGIR